MGRSHGAISTERSPQRDLDGMISQLDLAGTSSMAHLGLRWWSELDGTSPISLSLVSLRALSLSLSLSLCRVFFFRGSLFVFGWSLWSFRLYLGASLCTYALLCTYAFLALTLFLMGYSC